MVNAASYQREGTVMLERREVARSVGSILLERCCSYSNARHIAGTCIIVLLLCLTGQTGRTQNNAAQIRYDAGTRVFRIDAAEMTYAIGVNDKQEIQPLYWGKRLPDADHFTAARGKPAHASFDLPANTTPQEYVGWG